MPFTIPNTADAFVPAQAAPDSRDIDILVNAAGFAPSGVQLGAYTDCAVTTSAGLVLNVAAGTIRVRGAKATVTGGTVTITTAHATNPRFDLVVANTSGVKSVLAGTAAASPVFPTYGPAVYVVLAAVYVAANDTTIAANEITDKRMFFADPGFEHVDWYGAAVNAKTDRTYPTVGSSAAIAAAQAALPTGGGTVVFGPRWYGIDTKLVVNSNDIRWVGTGRNNTRLCRLSDITILDCIGNHATTTTTYTQVRFTCENLTFDANTTTTWVAPLNRMYYSAENMFLFCNWYAGGGVHIDATEFWDTYYYGCRWDGAGQNGDIYPSCYMRSSTGAGTGIGHSVDNTNNIWFVNCVWETNYSGDVWFMGRIGAGDGPVNKCRIVNAKMEQIFLGGIAIKMDQANIMYIYGLDITTGGFKGGFVTPLDQIKITNSNEIFMHGIHGEAQNNVAATIRTLLSVATTTHVTISGITGVWNTINKPTVGLVEIGPNVRALAMDGYGHNWDPAGNTEVIVGAPLTLAPVLRSDQRPVL